MSLTQTLFAYLSEIERSDPFPTEDEIRAEIARLRAGDPRTESELEPEVIAELVAHSYCVKWSSKEDVHRRVYHGGLVAPEDAAIVDEQARKYLPLVPIWRARSQALRFELRHTYLWLLLDFVQALAKDSVDHNDVRSLAELTAVHYEGNAKLAEHEDIERLAVALDYAKRFGLKELAARLSIAMVKLDQSSSSVEGEHVRGFSFPYLRDHPKLVVSPEQLEDSARAFQSVLEPMLVSDGARYCPYWVEDQVELLGKYFEGQERLSKSYELVEKCVQAASAWSYTANGLQAEGVLCKCNHLMASFGMTKHPPAFAAALASARERLNRELHVTETTVKISPETVDTIKAAVIHDSLIVSLQALSCSALLPESSELIAGQKEFESRKGILNFVNESSLDDQGMSTHRLQTADKDSNGALMEYCKWLFVDQAPLMWIAWQAIKDKYGSEAEPYFEAVSAGPAFPESMRARLKMGIKAMLSDDFISALHILVPLVESSLRHLAASVDATVSKANRYNASFWTTLDQILADPQVNARLGERLCTHIRAAMSETRGLNIRNNVCHGLWRDERFSWMSAIIVFHIIVLLGTCVYVDIGKPEG